MPLIAIVAMTMERVIGQGSKIPWRIPSDVAYFKVTTMGHPVVMGRKTYESIPQKYRPLPGRENIVLTRQANYQEPGCEVVTELEPIIQRAQSEDIFVAGGAEIYGLVLPIANRIHLTTIKQSFPGDIFLPEFDLENWQVITSEDHSNDPSGIPYILEILERK